MAAATIKQHNFIIRPRKNPTAELIQLDDLPANAATTLGAHAFLVLRTSPGSDGSGNFQAWVAVQQAPADFARRLRKGAGADPTASGASRISGSLNFKTKFAPAFPLVTNEHINPGHIVLPTTLEQAGIVAAPEPTAARVSPNRISLSRPQGRKPWPSYVKCLQNAPPVHQGDKPDVSRADFTWAMTAIDWGFDTEATAKRLMEESSKARENGESYAALTARNAAAAVKRRRGITPEPGLQG